MKTRDRFVREREMAWRELERLLDSSVRLDGVRLSRLSTLYREVCSDLMTTRAARYGEDLTGHLDTLAARGHAALYGTGRRNWRAGASLVLADFPRQIRQSRGYMAAAGILFFLPLVVGVIGATYSREFAEAILSPDQLGGMADAYSDDVSAGRSAGQNAFMAGFYVQNNVGIAFRCFATGILFGTGSVFFLVYNGLITGTVVGHVVASGHARNILTFVSGHAAFELGAIVVAGAAGLMLGASLIATGRHTRAASLRLAAKSTVPLMSGVFVMLVLAAITEGFWSPSSAPHQVKWVVAGMNALLVTLFWTRMARRTRSVQLGGRSA